MITIAFQTHVYQNPQGGFTLQARVGTYSWQDEGTYVTRREAEVRAQNLLAQRNRATRQAANQQISA